MVSGGHPGEGGNPTGMRHIGPHHSGAGPAGTEHFSSLQKQGGGQDPGKPQQGAGGFSLMW